jgi:hypothetical protein
MGRARLATSAFFPFSRFLRATAARERGTADPESRGERIFTWPRSRECRGVFVGLRVFSFVDVVGLFYCPRPASIYHAGACNGFLYKKRINDKLVPSGLFSAKAEFGVDSRAPGSANLEL